MQQESELPQWARERVLDWCVSSRGDIIIGVRAVAFTCCLRALPSSRSFSWRTEKGDGVSGYTYCPGVATLDGLVYGCDHAHNRIQVFHLVDGSVVDTFGEGQVTQPCRVRVTEAKVVVLCDNDCIVVFCSHTRTVLFMLSIYGRGEFVLFDPSPTITLTQHEIIVVKHDRLEAFDLHDGTFLRSAAMKNEDDVVDADVQESGVFIIQHLHSVSARTPDLTNVKYLNTKTTETMKTMSFRNARRVCAWLTSDRVFHVRTLGQVASSHLHLTHITHSLSSHLPQSPRSFFLIN